MKLRIIEIEDVPEHGRFVTVQVKRWWWPVWVTKRFWGVVKANRDTIWADETSGNGRAWCQLDNAILVHQAEHSRIETLLKSERKAPIRRTVLRAVPGGKR